MGINGGRGINSGLVLGGSGINIAGSGEAPFSFGNALQFDGVNDYVSITEIDLADNTNFTVSAWIKTTVGTTDSINRVAAPILGDNTGGQYIAFGIDGGVAIFHHYAGAWQKESATTNIADGEWHHIVWVNYSNKTMDIYVDAVKEVSAASSVSSSVFAEINSIGASLQRVLDGVLDETFIITGTAITQTNVNDLYNSGNGALASDIITPTAYWRFNGTSGDSTAIDETGTLNGTLKNFSTPPAYFIPH